jgi:hypothetical protein
VSYFGFTLASNVILAQKNSRKTDDEEEKTMFRSCVKAIVAGAVVLGALGAVDASFSDAHAGVHRKKRALYVRVTPRSYLDAGKVAPVGSLSQYATSNRYSAPVSAGIDKGFGNYLLPDAIGGGRNPFGSF